MNFSARRVLLATAVALCLAACGGSNDVATKATTQADGAIESTDDSVDLTVQQGDDGEFSVESDDGSLTVNGNGSLPDGFPASVAIPQGWVIEGSTNMGSGDQQAWVVGFQLAIDPEAATEDLSASLRGAGFSEISNMTTGDGSVIGWENAEHYVQAIVAPGDQGVGSVASLTVSTKSE